jgi:hypothetical protein
MVEQPLLNVFTSVVALFLLALQSHEQDRETLSACSPLVDAVLMRPTRSDGSIVGSIVGRETMGAMLRRYGLAALLQFFWSIRVASVPVLALQGSAMLFASLPSAADIVVRRTRDRTRDFTPLRRCCAQSAFGRS